jgi:hypothetical protein
MASKAPSRVETPKVGTAPLKGARMAILISFAGAAAPPQAVSIMLATTNSDRTTNKRLDILLPPYIEYGADWLTRCTSKLVGTDQRFQALLT